MQTYFHSTKYCSKEVEIEYEIESEGESNFCYPGHICDGGGSGPIICVLNVTSEQGTMLFTDQQRWKWEENLAETYVPNDYHPEPDDYY